jgi:hypothetical protein
VSWFSRLFEPEPDRAEASNRAVGSLVTISMNIARQNGRLEGIEECARLLEHDACKYDPTSVDYSGRLYSARRLWEYLREVEEVKP